MTERVFCFGPNDGLAGVLTEPEADRYRNDKPTVIWLNAGVLHSVGPFGWYVTLARRLAENEGVSSFRLDLSGTGDSVLQIDGKDNLERYVADVTAAMDLLANERDARQFVLVGLCSGAILAQHLAAHEKRVSAAVLLDGWGYRTTGFYLRHYVRRVLRWRSWTNTLGKLLARTKVGRGDRGRSLDDRALLVREYYLEFPSPEIARGASCRDSPQDETVVHVYRRHSQVLQSSPSV